MPKNGSKKKGKDGNTKRPSPAKKWVFTFNNYSKSNIEDLIKTFGSVGSKYLFQEEKGENGTPHLQGMVIFNNKCRPLEGQKFNKTIHWELMRGSIQDSIRYCTKEDTKNGKIYSNFYRPLNVATYDSLRPNQKEVVEIVKKNNDDRSVLWFWEEEGNWGKSYITRYFIDNLDAFVVSGKGTDILYGLFAYIQTNGYCPPIVILDIPRSIMGRVSYGAIESIKNGYFFNAKYEGGMVRFTPPTVVVFANEEPDLDALSLDRWVVRRLPPSEGVRDEGEVSPPDPDVAPLGATSATSGSPEETSPLEEIYVRF